jgi:glycerophosphoryl diester phosphodiesterase
MKKYFTVLWIVLLTTCSSKNNIDTDTTPVLSVNETDVALLGCLPKDFTLDVTAAVPIVFDKPEWIVEKEGNEWVSGTKTYGFSTEALPLGVSSREGTLVVRSDSTVAPVSVKVTQRALTRVIAHRGYWNKAGSAQNSLSSLQNAIDLGVHGSELDVWITTDGVIVLNHDASYGGVTIENSAYAAIEPLRLSNGEPLPTLQQCIDLAKQQTQPDKTKLIIEIKPHSNNTNNKRCVDAVVQAVNDAGAADLVDYISFSSYVCEELIKLNAQHRVAYLNGEKTPEQLKAAGYWGLDYDLNILKAHSNWIHQAREAGLTTNVWTVDNTSDLRYFIAADIDFITTNAPQALKEMLEN